MHAGFPEAAEFRRRYTAVAISDDRIGNLSDLRSLSQQRVGNAERLPASRGVTLYRLELLDSVFRYSTIDSPTLGQQLQPHLGYVAFFQGHAANTTLLVSPFTRLLARLVRDLNAEADPPIAGFYRFNVGRLISEIRSNHLFPVEDVAAVTLRVQGDAPVDLVRLTGSAPLVSTLLASVEGMRFTPPSGPAIDLAIPYALVVRIREGLEDPVRLTIDRHGNVHWYQLGEPAVSPVVDVLRVIELEGGVVTVDPRVPLEQNKLSAPH